MGAYVPLFNSGARDGHPGAPSTPLSMTTRTGLPINDRSSEHTARTASALTRATRGTVALLLRILVLGALVPAARASCSSSATCPAHALDRLQTCYMPGSPMVSNWQGQRLWSFMGNGLYTIGKISKDETNCCYDVEVQAFLIPILSRDGTTRVRTCMLSNLSAHTPLFVPGALFPSHGPTSLHPRAGEVL